MKNIDLFSWYGVEVTKEQYQKAINRIGDFYSRLCCLKCREIYLDFGSPDCPFCNKKERWEVSVIMDSKQWEPVTLVSILPNIGEQLVRLFRLADDVQEISIKITKKGN